MLIVTADDYGRERQATDSILLCGAKGRITSASAMVFMQDSERAAALAGDSPVEFGLHLNFTELPTGTGAPSLVCRHLERVRRFLSLHRLAPALFNPRLQHSFRILVEAQREEYERLYRTVPVFYNGHHHMHLCANVLLGGLIPRASRIRTTFTFESGEKSLLNRAYRRILTRWVRSALHVDRLVSFDTADSRPGAPPPADAQVADPGRRDWRRTPSRGGEAAFLLGESYQGMLAGARLGGFRALVKREEAKSAAPVVDGTVRQ